MSTPERREAQRFESMAAEAMRHEILPVWLFIDDAKEDVLSLITDMSVTGLSMILPKDTQLKHKMLELKIFSSEPDEIESLTISAEQRWVDENYAIDHKKVGFKFNEPKPELISVINRILDWLSQEEEHYLQCVIKKN